MSEPIEHDTPAREAKMLAEARKAEAEAEYFQAKTHGQRVDNETATALSISAGIAVKRETLKDQWDAASNGRNRAYHFTDNVSTDTVEAAVDVFNRWQRLDVDNQDPYRLIICSPGGSVVSGMKLYSTIKAIAAKRPVITVASGLCASMATIIHQAGSYRIIEPGCSYMIHDVSGEVFGSLTNMQDTMDWLAKLNSALHVCLAEKSHKTVEEIAEMSKRRDSWFMPEDVVEMGFADEIGFATE